MYNLFLIFDDNSWKFKMIGRFIIVLYDRVNIHENVYEAQREKKKFFRKNSWKLENISPTQYALYLRLWKLPYRLEYGKELHRKSRNTNSKFLRLREYLWWIGTEVNDITRSC